MSNQGERIAIRAQQQMLAVVEGCAVEYHAAGPATQRLRGLEHGDGNAGGGQGHGGREACPTAADYGDIALGCPCGHQARTQVFQAIQSLRTGVNAMRWCSTRPCSLSISSSKV